MSTTTRRTTTAVLAACLLLAGTAASAGAGPAPRGLEERGSEERGFEERDHAAGRFYGNFDLDVVLFTGDLVTNICLGAAEPIVSARVFDRHDGRVDLVARGDLPVFLYETPLGAPEFIDATCTAMFDGDPTTEPVEAFASGTARFRERISVGTDGVEEHDNGVNGTATGTDGTTYRVRTWADFTIDDGVLLGDPAEFQGLSLHRVGR